jgi:hypothetical protein
MVDANPAVTPPSEITKPFTDAIAEAEKLVASAEFIRTEQDLAEGYEYLAGSIRAIVQLAWAYDKGHPFFVSSTGPYTKMGLDNPDTLYYSANIVDDAEYVVTGKRGTTTDLAFQIIAGQYTADEVPPGDQAFDDRQLEIADDGSFVVRFGPPKADPGPNYFAIAPGATTLSVREVYSDWNAERKGSIRIERVDTVGTPPVEADIETLTKRYKVAGKMLLSRINTWFNFPKWFYLDLPVNTFTEPRLTPGGLATQFSSVGHYDLADDEAMIITVPKSAAPYQGFQLGSMWYISLDYVNHQTSLNSSQAQVDPDGNIRMVVSRKNPGVANWIETTGRQRGILQFRWQRTDAPITASEGPTAQVVELSDVPQHLPHFEHNQIDDAGWRDRIAARQRGFSERMLG